MTTPDFDAIAETISPDQCGEAIGARPSGTRGMFHCPCPGHENGDEKASLSIYRVSGRTVVHGFSCDLRGSPVQAAASVWGVSLPDAAARLVAAVGITTLDTRPYGSGLGEIVTTYEYTDEEGGYLFEVVRYAHPKDFRQRVRGGDGSYDWSTKGVRRVLYQLPEVRAAVAADVRLFIVEGEKDADRLASMGFAATTCPSGAGKWRDEYSAYMAGARVCILPDNDDQGQKHAQKVAQALHGVAVEVRVVDLPGVPLGGDVSDWLDAGGTADALKALMSAVPLWEPTPGNHGEPDEDQDDGEPANLQGPRVRCMGDIEPEEVTWLWGGRIPLGKLSEIVGDPGVGKSTLTLAVVASVTTGTALPGDHNAVPRPPTSVLLLSAEDDAGDTIRPRLDRAGADVSLVHIFDGIQTIEGGLDLFDLKDPLHRHYLAGEMTKLGVSLLVIDPLTAYLGGVDSHRDSEVRGVLAPLAEIAASTGCAVLAVRHLNKGSGGRAMYRAGGSIGFTASVRSSLIVGQLDEDSDERFVVGVKSNLAALAPAVGFSLENGQFEWTKTMPDIVAADLLKPDTDSEERSDRKVTAEWLLDVLRDGPMAAAEVFKKADTELSVSKATVKRAKRDLGDSVETYRESQGNEGEGRWLWKLARGSRPSDTVAKLEVAPLARTVVPQGIPVSAGSPGVQGAQDNSCEPLTESDDPEPDADNDYAREERLAIQAESDASPASGLFEDF